MAAQPTVEPHSGQGSFLGLAMTPSLAQILGLGATGRELSAAEFHAGLRPVMVGLKNGTLTEQQAVFLIKLLASAYAGAAVNRQIETLFQNWAGRLTAARAGENYGGR